MCSEVGSVPGNVTAEQLATSEPGSADSCRSDSQTADSELSDSERWDSENPTH